MQTLSIFFFIYLAMIATSFWEAYAEGRNAWDKGKIGWKVKIGKNLELTAYHFWVFWVMFPSLILLPLFMYGFNIKIFGILMSAYFSGLIIEDFFWYVVNPQVRLKEFWTEFSDYYPWFKIKGKKIIPVGYILGIIVSVGSWYFLWR